MSFVRHSPLCAIAALLALGAAGCSSDDPASVVPVCVSYAPAAQPTAGKVVTRASLSSSCEVLELELLLTGADDVHSIGFNVVYNPAQLFFAGWSTDGSALAEGAALIVPTPSGPEGDKLITVTRTGPGSAVGVDFDDDDLLTDNLLLKLLFLRFGNPGTQPLTFKDTSVLAITLATPPLVEIPVSWNGGAVTVK